VPPTWASCTRCGTDLAGAVEFRAPAPSRPAAPAAPPADPSRAVNPPTAPPSRERAGYFGGAPPPKPPGSVSGPADAPAVWELAPPPREQRRVPTLLLALLVAVAGVAGWFGYDRFLAADDVELEEAARAWVDGESEVPVRNVLGGFEAELPVAPQTIDQVAEVDGQTVAVHMEVSEVAPDYVALVGWFEMPGASEADLETLFADSAGDVQLEGNVDGFDAEISMEQTTQDGHEAFDMEVAGEGMHMKGRFVVVGSRLYLLMLVSPNEDDPGWDRLVESFEVLGSGGAAA